MRHLKAKKEEHISAIKFIKKNDPKASLILIDYVQRLHLGHKNTNARHEEVKEICRSLEACAIATG